MANKATRRPTDGNVYIGKCRLKGVYVLHDGTVGSGNLSIRDNVDGNLSAPGTATGTVRHAVELSTVFVAQFFPMQELDVYCPQGIHVDLPGGYASCTVIYEPMDSA